MKARILYFDTISCNSAFVRSRMASSPKLLPPSSPADEIMNKFELSPLDLWCPSSPLVARPPIQPPAVNQRFWWHEKAAGITRKAVVDARLHTRHVKYRMMRRVMLRGNGLSLRRVLEIDWQFRNDLVEIVDILIAECLKSASISPGNLVVDV